MCAFFVCACFSVLSLLCLFASFCSCFVFVLFFLCVYKYVVIGCGSLCVWDDFVCVLLWPCLCVYVCMFVCVLLLCVSSCVSLSIYMCCIWSCVCLCVLVCLFVCLCALFCVMCFCC